MKPLMLVLVSFVALAAERPLYLDPSQPAEKRVQDLLSRMTLAEKVGQMNMPCVYEGGLGKDVAAKLQGCRAFTAGSHVSGLGPGGGFFTLANTILHEGPRKQAEYFNELQRIAIEKTRLGIPLLQTEEGTHGLMCSGGTVFPEGLALGSAWNLGLIDRVYTAAAAEARAVGIHQLFTLVVEPYRDPRLGRSQEGYSEDPWLVSRIAETIVRAAQGRDVAAPDKVVAGLCHYPGQSEPLGGMERGAMNVSERKLRESFLPPWFAGIKGAGALGVMATYPAIDGVPAHSSDWILTKILRDEMNFQGLVLSEGGGIGTLVYEGVAADMKEAGQLALHAGLDVGISYEEGYMVPLIESVKEGKVATELVDRAVRRILTQKFRLGLFEKPYVDPEFAEKGVDRAGHRQLSLEAAREGIVLLKNAQNVLPLAKSIKRIAVIGPNADHARNQLGDYTSRTVLQDVVTVLEGIRAKAPGAKVTYVQGCDVIGTRVNQIADAERGAREADVAIVVVGENEWQGPQGTSGEGYDAVSLDLTGMQENLIKAVHATGTPTIVVLINGRPLSTRWAAEHVPAIVEAWFPGEMGGAAVADVLFGDVNPSGRLPVTVPRHVGQLPAYYNHDRGREHWMKHSWAKNAPYVGLPATPLYPFGHGLTYTTFEYSGLEVSPIAVSESGAVEIAFTVKNTGQREGREVAQVYIRDAVSSVVRPVKELKGFEKVVLEPGEQKRITVRIPVSELAFYDRSMRRVVEPGRFEVQVGGSAEDIRLRGAFEVKSSSAAHFTGKTKYLNNARAVVTHTFDDSVPQVADALDALDRYGVKSTAFIDTGRKSMTALWPRINLAIANGHEAGSHSRQHQCAWPETEDICRKFYTPAEITGSRD
ncbi:MAG TPA: glycoside hydrolase family 3 C-terminal domain-containing protein, partial [Bryobacteraceae bacterium]|nr:glycoside hydrolase family 3 C-terminal domain-containing protein [Bryobacteraceae bacterium]